MTTFIQRNFAAGEISPLLYSRVDQTRYQTGLRTCRNFQVLRSGGAQNRAGTTFVAEAKGPCVLVPFIFNAAQTYVIEMGNGYIRFHTSGAQVVEATKTLTAATQANPCVLTSNAHGYSNGDEVAISGVVGMTQLNGRNFKVANVTANTFSLQFLDGSAVDSTAFSAYVSGGTAARVYTISSTYAAQDVGQLSYAQSGDIITFTHPTYPPRELRRIAATNWTLTDVAFAPGIATPTSGGSAVTTGGTSTIVYYVTAVAVDTLEESLPLKFTFTSVAGVASFTIAAQSGVQYFNIYKDVNGVGGYVGKANVPAGGGTPVYAPDATPPDTTIQPPSARNPFGSTGNYPSAVTYYQQRLSFGGTNNDPQKVWMSQTGNFKNFTISTPLQADDAVTFSAIGRRVNLVRHLLDLGRFAIFTSGAIYVAAGDQAGGISPTAINPKYGGRPSSSLAPLIIGESALYVQARTGIVRDLAWDFQVDGYRGNDITVFSSHFFDGAPVTSDGGEGRVITAWAYQETPHSTVWMVGGNDVGGVGTSMYGVTYVKEQQIIGWHRHDTKGTFTGVCAVPEGGEDALYAVVTRTINGASKNYIERFAVRTIGEDSDYQTAISDTWSWVFSDCSLVRTGGLFDGIIGTPTLTITGGTNWTYTETLTLTSSVSLFAASDIGSQVVITSSEGIPVRFTITAFTSATVVSAMPDKTVPVALRSVALSSSATITLQKAVLSVTGLWHLEGQAVSVFADGVVVASPNNAAYPVLTVTNGSLTFSRPYAHIVVGLPYISDLETLDIDTAQGETIADKKKFIGRVTVEVADTRGLWAGARKPTNDAVDPLEGLYELKIRETEGYDSPVSLTTGSVEIKLQSEWNSNGRIFLRQVDPLPVTVTAVLPDGKFPFRQGA